MKWPNSVTIFRHGQSAYNALKHLKEADPDYQAFKAAFAADYQSVASKVGADMMMARYPSLTSDYKTPLTEVGRQQAIITGKRLYESHVNYPNLGPYKPDVILVSPYDRTVETGALVVSGWPGCDTVPVVYDDRIREQEHGLALLYGDWRIFHVKHPEQKLLHDLLGPYAYQYPQGESVTQVRDRVRSFLTMIIREYAGANLWIFSHHLTKLSFRANLERLTPEQFIHLDENEKPVNCGVTNYIGEPNLGRDGKLVLDFYNTKLYKDDEVNP